jgi:hypothetical protein
VLEDVSWQGQPSVCVSVNFDSSAIERLLGSKAAFDHDAPRLALSDAHVVDLVNASRRR